MPRYNAPATLLTLRNDRDYDIENGVLSVDFAGSRFSYSYGSDWGGDDTIIEVGGQVTPRAISFDGESILDNGLGVTEAALFDLHWGAGRETRVLSVAGSDFHFDDADLENFEEIDFEALDFTAVLVPISGDVLPDLGKGGLALFDEMDLMIDDDTDGRITEGPMAPGRSFDAGLLFADDTSGFLRQGDNGRDRLLGKGSDDLLIGGGGRDVLKGRGGDDTLMAGSGEDKILGGGGHDMLSGWSGDDRLLGQKGNDTIFGGNGRDVVLGQKGNDELFGGAGDDRLKGGGGGDLIEGQSGDDVIDGGKGDDRLTGGVGADSFVFSRKGGEDEISDFGQDDDRLRLNDNLWRGQLDAGAVIDRFAQATEEGLLFDFGNKGSVLLEGVSIDGIAAHVALAETIEIF